MKKNILIVVILTTAMLVGCGKDEPQATISPEITETIIHEEILYEEILYEEILYEDTTTYWEEEPSENLLEGFSNYSEDYIGELFYNSITEVMSYEDGISLVEYGRELESEGYSDCEIEYILLRRCGIL